MEKIHWKDEYSLGLDKVDRQHQHMFEIINKIIDCPNQPKCVELAGETLKEMIDYARVHFADEEMLMQKYGYPEIESHKKQHDYFINTTAELAVNFMDNQNTTGDEIAEFLALWLTNHILKSDMKYRDFFKAKITANAESSI